MHEQAVVQKEALGYVIKPKYEPNFTTGTSWIYMGNLPSNLELNGLLYAVSGEEECAFFMGGTGNWGPRPGALPTAQKREETGRITVYDIKGKEIFTAPDSREEFTISSTNLSEGMYVINQKDKNGVINQKKVLYKK